MAAKIKWHRNGTKLRHCQPVYTDWVRRCAWTASRRSRCRLSWRRRRRSRRFRGRRAAPASWTWTAPGRLAAAGRGRRPAHLSTAGAPPSRWGSAAAGTTPWRCSWVAPRHPPTRTRPPAAGLTPPSHDPRYLLEHGPQHTNRLESRRGQLCSSRQPLRYTALGTGCAPLLQCLDRLSLPPFVGR